VDASEPELFPEARAALYEVMGARELRHKRLLVLANKQDLPGALGPDEIAERLDLDGLSWNRWYVQVRLTSRAKRVKIY
jgi:signal recognition particle receptor subunit beta